MKITEKSAGWLIGKEIYFGDEGNAEISLRTEKWEHTKYGDDLKHIVDFPGEYDIAGYAIRCIEADGKLHFVFSAEDKQYALLQNPAALEVTNFENIDVWICGDAEIKEEIERLEYEGELVVLGEEE